VSRILTKTLFVVGLLASLSAFGAAQEKRSVKQRGAVSYPDLAKKMNVQGTVKVEVLVLPSGAVRAAKAIGGHPLLIDAAVNAAKNFKFEPAAAETKEEIPFNFTLNAN
jgi:TonB family protein